MSERIAARWITALFRMNHDNALAAVEAMDDAQLRWRPPRSNSVGFNLWHMTRWADRTGSHLDGRAELWHAEGLGRAWGFPSELGGHDTGMQMDEQEAARLPLPARDRLIEYARRAFARLDEALAALDEAELTRPAAAASHLDTGEWLLAQFRHDSRHLGMIEALKGAQGIRGTVSR